MNKKLTFSGGEPDINLDDLLRDPIANRAAMFALMGGLTDEDSIITGATATVTGTTSASVTDGYVWLDGEILQVDAATVTDDLSSGLWEFQKVVAYDALGDKTFNDLTSRQTWQKNRAVLTNVASITGMDATARTKILKTKVFEIGSWDMSADTFNEFILSDTAFEDAVGLQVIIRSDTDFVGTLTAKDDLNNAGLAQIVLDSSTGNTLVSLTRDASGKYDSVNYDDTTINRGFVTVTYLG